MLAVPICGDGRHRPALGDEGGEQDTVDEGCEPSLSVLTVPVCGDGRHRPALGDEG